MNKNNIFIPIIVVGISIAFIIVSLLVFFSRGKPSFIKKKLQIGSLLLAFTASSTLGMASCISIPDCYGNIDDGDGGSEYDSININSDHLVDGHIFVNLSNNTKIYGTITYRHSKEFSYKITKPNLSSIVVGENLYALDGYYDEYNEEFEIDFSNVEEGTYCIYFYNCSLQDQIDSYYDDYIVDYQLVIVNEQK